MFAKHIKKYWQQSWAIDYIIISKKIKYCQKNKKDVEMGVEGARTVYWLAKW